MKWNVYIICITLDKSSFSTFSEEGLHALEAFLQFPCFITVPRWGNIVTVKWFIFGSQDSINSIETSYGLKWMVWSSNPSRGKILYLLQNQPNWLWDTPSLLFNGYPGSSIGVKWLGHVNHSPPTSTEVKNELSYTFAPPIHLHDMDRDNFTFDLKFYIQLVSVIINWIVAIGLILWYVFNFYIWYNDRCKHV